MVKALDCASAVLVGEFAVSVCELGMLVFPFAVSGFEWVVFSLVVKALGIPFSALIRPFGTLDAPFCIFPLGWVSRSFGFAVSGFGWAGFSLAVKVLN